MSEPVYFSPELGAEICKLLASGMTLRAVCRQDGMPSPSAVLDWTETHKEFGEQYTRARQRGYEVMADEVVDIVDDGSNDYVERETRRGGTEQVLDTEHVARSRLRFDARRWLLSKALPKIYGEKLGLEHSGEITVNNREFDDEAMAVKIDAIFAAAERRLAAQDTGEDLV